MPRDALEPPEGKGSVGGSRAQTLLERGLEKYARGDLLGALNDWEHARSVDPGATRAAEYIQYVRDNFDALAEQFAAARAATEAGEAAGVPVSEAADDPDAYDSLELSQTTPTPTPIPGPAPLPPPPAHADDHIEIGLTSGDLHLGDLHVPAPDEDLAHDDTPLALEPAGAPFDLENPGTNESTIQRGAVLTIRPKSELTPTTPVPEPSGGGPSPILDLDLGPALEGHAAGLEAPPTEEPFSLGEEDTSDGTRPRARSFGGQFAEEVPTRERRSLLDMPPPPPEPGSDAEQNDDDDRAAGLAREASAGDRIRRRVNEHMNQAMLAADAGDFSRAVAMAEEAAASDPDGLIAPVILSRHKDFLHRIYEGHLGDPSQVPLVAVPLHEIAAQQLDHRTGFLLSRIDGMLTFEDILDIAGMPRLEAYRILSSLLRRGFIEVR